MNKLLMLLLLTGCALTMPDPVERGKKSKAKETHTQRMEKCLYRLIEQNGVKAEEAERVCSSIFRRK